MSSSENYRRVCSLCGASSFKNIYGDKHFLIKCRSCSLVSSNRIPSDDELKHFYDEYYVYESLSSTTIQRYNKILDQLESFRHTNNLLETGCGPGFFLEEARKRNWNVFGTEYSEKFLDVCKKKNIPVSKTIDVLPGNMENNFDVIVSIEVIEHLINPIAEIKKYSEILQSGGVLYITTPNFNSLSRRLIGKKWNVINYPEHLFYFTGSTINKLMKKNNFRKIYHRSSGLSAGRLIAFTRSRKNENDQAPQNYDYNEKDRQLRDSIEKNFLLRAILKIINSLLSLFMVGDALKIMYQKK